MRKVLRASAILGSAGLLGLSNPAPADAQAAGQALVIRGGTLIDGNGGEPVENAVVVIQGNQIAAAGPANQVDVPEGAEIVDATGKWILPGLWDGQASYSWFFGELYLNHGVTSQVDIGLGAEVSLAARNAVNMGHQRGPREWIGIAHFGGFGEEEIHGYETPYDGRQRPQTFEELQAHTRLLLDRGADMIMFHDGDWDPEWVRWACDEAHTRGKPCFQRAGGPRMGAREAALAGVDVIHHSRGIGDAVVADGVDANHELEKYAAMDEAKAMALVDLIVREEVYLVPNIIHEAPGYPAEWEEMQTAYHDLFSDPELLAYYPDNFQKRLARTRRVVDQGELRERRMPGYRNMIRFHKMVIDAGGKVLIGGDTNGAKVPGSIVHEEMAIFQEGGISPMQIIMGATRWPAEAMRVIDRIGTVEAGKLADIIIVNADPLQDIGNLRQIDTVIFNGDVIDHGIHASYSVPFWGYDGDQRYTINDGHWVRDLKEFTGNVRPRPTAPDPDDVPQPAIEMIAPTAIKRGSAAAILELTGFNFVAGTRVLVDGQSVPWEWVDGTKINVMLDENLLSQAGRREIVLQNPEPLGTGMWGDGTSNSAFLLVEY
jgi:imidazolonepropionase-like amidohydrolase